MISFFEGKGIIFPSISFYNSYLSLCVGHSLVEPYQHPPMGPFSIPPTTMPLSPHNYLLFPLFLISAVITGLSEFREAVDAIHIAMTLDTTYLRGSAADVFSVLQHSCPENIVFHFVATSHRSPDLHCTIASTFPYLTFHLYHFNVDLVRGKITYSIRPTLDQPLNYVRMYLVELLPTSVHRIIYFDLDLIVVDDVTKLWSIEYCHANFTAYFTPGFWSSLAHAAALRGRRPCYFNTGVMVIDLWRWREGRYTERLEGWMRIQKRERIYELGSLPPFLLVFAGEVEGVEHRWNQHGLGGDNVRGQCRDLHPGPVSLLHWSGKGKPWLRLDSRRPCPLDSLWAPYDLLRHPSLFSDI